MLTSKTFVWKDPRPMTLAVIIAMTINIVWAVAGIAIILSGVHVDVSASAGANAGMTLMLSVYGLLTIVVLASNIVRVFWILRVSRNAYVLKGRSLANSPIFTALWWYLIPFMSLFKPWESLVEIWDVSAIDHGRRRRFRFIIGVWWISLLISAVLSYISEFSHNKSLNVIGFSIGIVGYGSLIFIAKTIHDMQLEKRLGLTFSDEPDRPIGVLERLNV